MRAGRVALAALAAAVAYLCLRPVPIEPVAWTPQRDAGYAGVHARNERLAHLQLIDIGDEVGPEHIAAGPDGKVYFAVASGKLMRMNPDGRGREVFAQSGGRILGFDFDAAGNVIAADAYRGLLRVTPGGQVSQLADRVGPGDFIAYADAVVVAGNGKIYLSDASRRFAPPAWGGTFAASFLDILEQRATGRVLEYDPATNRVRVVATGLSFANGIALTADETALLINETGRYRVWRIAVDADAIDLADGGDRSGKATVLLDNLPGFPDNLMRGRDGRIWLGFAKPRGPALDALAGWPFLRKVILRLPKVVWPVPKAYGHVIAFTESGQVVADLQDPSGAYPETTGITETPDRLYVQSLHSHAIGWLPAKVLGR